MMFANYAINMTYVIDVTFVNYVPFMPLALIIYS